MTKLHWRVGLALAGLVIILASLAAIAYVLWPLQPTIEQSRNRH